MSSRGESSFVRMPRFGARLYDSLIRVKAVEGQFKEVAQDLVSRLDGGRLLDIGTGPGRLLVEIHRLNPDIELYGLDISGAMVQQARSNLAGIPADLRQGTIRHTDYEAGFFDAVTCTGSFYLWDHPQECLDEIHRIMKAGRSAYLFETHRDYDADRFRQALRANLRGEGLPHRLITPVFLKRQLRMTYHAGEVTGIIERTRFSGSYAIEQIVLGGLPVWLRITLTKESTR